MRHLAYNVRYSVAPMNSSLLTITIHFSVIKTLVYNEIFHDVITELDGILILLLKLWIIFKAVNF
jgi:hypothetical protein